MTTLPQSWVDLRYRVAASGFILDRAVYEHIQQLFLASTIFGAVSPGEWTREYDQEEYLLVVDRTGQPVLPEPALLDAFEAMAGSQPAFRRWFQATRLPDGPHYGEPVLLAARWLCHLSGLRHITVELFLDPPAQPGSTLVQIRGLAKVESPGDFDLPCAGHISGVDGVAASMAKELEEELGLVLADLDDFREVMRFDAPDEDGPEPRNHEFRVLYQARLKAGSAASIRLREGEVAGLAIISLPELRELVARYPERVASGIQEALVFYQ